MSIRSELKRLWWNPFNIDNWIPPDTFNQVLTKAEQTNLNLLGMRTQIHATINRLDATHLLLCYVYVSAVMSNLKQMERR